MRLATSHEFYWGFEGGAKACCFHILAVRYLKQFGLPQQEFKLEFRCMQTQLWPVSTMQPRVLVGY